MAYLGVLMGKQLVLAEKPSVAREIARVLGCNRRESGFIEGENYIVTWALGHLIELAPPGDYNPRRGALPQLMEEAHLLFIP
jgi:DNA topoisomerase IA